MAKENPQLMSRQDTRVGRTLDRLQRATSLPAKPITESVDNNGAVTSFYRRRGVSLTVTHASGEAPKVSKPLLRRTDFRVDGDTYAVNVSAPVYDRKEQRRRVVDAHGHVDQALANAHATLNTASVNRGVAQHGAELTVTSDANSLEIQDAKATIGQNVLGNARVASESSVHIHGNAEDLSVYQSGVVVDGDVTGKIKVFNGQILVKGDANVVDSYRSTVKVTGVVQEAECFAGSLTAREIVTKKPGTLYMKETGGE